MIIISGSMSFAATDREDVLASLHDITDVSRLDAGCVEYWWSEDLAAPNTFRFFECWEDQETFDAHMNAPHEAAFGERNLGRMVDATATLFSATYPES